MINVYNSHIAYHRFYYLQFFKLFRNDATALDHAKNEITIFSPTDAAMRAFKGETNHQVLMNSMGMI